MPGIGKNVKSYVSAKGQITLPADLMARDRIERGQEFKIERLARGDYRIVRTPKPNDAVVEWLFACPDKGFFVPIESESTATIR